MQGIREEPTNRTRNPHIWLIKLPQVMVIVLYKSADEENKFFFQFSKGT